jgi:hypothetical protein
MVHEEEEEIEEEDASLAVPGVFLLLPLAADGKEIP